MIWGLQRAGIYAWVGTYGSLHLNSSTMSTEDGGPPQEVEVAEAGYDLPR